MKYDSVIINGLLVLEDQVARKNLGIRDGKIAAILEETEAIEPETGAGEGTPRILDAQGCYVLPGAIDTHTHVFEPGAEYREDFAHGTRAAAGGGFTCIMEMPNSNPAVVDADTFFLKKSLAGAGAVVDYAIWAGATAANLDRLPELKSLGCVAYKAFTLDAGPAFPYLNAELEMDAMNRIAGTGRVLGFHAEDPVIIGELAKKYSGQTWNLRLHEEARPYYAELSAISQILLFAGETGCPVHICHLSIPEGARLIARAKQEGVDVTVESCSHYFLLNTENSEQFDTYALIQPPIRSRGRMEAMWEYLLDGTIDYLATDHAPYPAGDKEPEDGNKWGVMGGAPSIDVAFPLMFGEAVTERGMSPVRFARLSATNAAKRFGLYPQKGSIRVGSDADLVILDPDQVWQVDRSKSYSKTKSTRFPYQGRTVKGKVMTTMVRGTVVYDGTNICVNSGFGQFVRPEK